MLVLLGCAGPQATLSDDIGSEVTLAERSGRYRTKLAQFERSATGVMAHHEYQRVRRWLDRLEAEEPDSILAPALEAAVVGHLEVLETTRQREALEGRGDQR